MIFTHFYCKTYRNNIMLGFIKASADMEESLPLYEKTTIVLKNRLHVDLQLAMCRLVVLFLTVFALMGICASIYHSDNSDIEMFSPKYYKENYVMSGYPCSSSENVILSCGYPNKQSNGTETLERCVDGLWETIINCKLGCVPSDFECIPEFIDFEPSVKK